MIPNGLNNKIRELKGGRENTMPKYYFTFGQGHIHRINNKTFDHNCVVEIVAENGNIARDIMFNIFGAKWCFQYDEGTIDMSYFPRGIMTI